MNIWPFSTIRRLREEVASLKADLNAANFSAFEFARECGNLIAELEQARKNDMPRDNKGRFVSKVAHD